MPEEMIDMSGKTGELDAEKLKALFDESSRTNRNLLLSFLVAVVYIFITVGAVTDRQILIPDSKVILPLLNVGIGLFGFFVIAPLILVIVHFDVLFNLYQHTRKLRRWVNARGVEDEVEYYPFLYNFAVTTNAHWTIRVPLRFATAVLYCYFPVLVLIYTQVKFAKYHSVEMSVWHCLLVVADILLVFVYWVRLRREGMEAEDKGKIKSLRWRERFKRSNNMIYVTLATLLIISAINVVIVTWIVAGGYHKTALYMLSDGFRNRLFELRIRNMLEQSVKAENVKNTGDAWSYVLENLIAASSDFLLPRINVFGETLLAEKPSDTILLHYLNKHKNAHEAISEANTNFARGINLQGRDLKYANFTSTEIMKANLSGADIEGGDVRFANLEGADLVGANLQGANLTASQLQGVNLRGANLQNADLSFADLQGVHLFAVNLRGAFLPDADFRGAVLIGVNFNGADLRSASLQGASLIETDLRGAVISEVDLKCISFRYKELFTENLNGAFIEGIKIEKEPDWAMLEKWKTKEEIDAIRDKCKKNEAAPFAKHKNDINKYFDVHKQLACEFPGYAKNGLEYRIEFIKQKTDPQTYNNLLAGLRAHLKENCPSALEYIKDLN